MQLCLHTCLLTSRETCLRHNAPAGAYAGNDRARGYPFAPPGWLPASPLPARPPPTGSRAVLSGFCRAYAGWQRLCPAPPVFWCWQTGSFVLSFQL